MSWSKGALKMYNKQGLLTWYFTWTLLDEEPPHSHPDNHEEDDNDQGNAYGNNWKQTETYQ